MIKTTEITASWEVTRKEVGRITLCGSTKFRAEYELWNKRLTLAGFLVYSVAGFGHSGDVFNEEEKVQLDIIHLAKIDASHAIVVINPGGYIGESTKREIIHAVQFGKDVFYTDPGPGRTVYELRTGPDGPTSLRYRAFDWGNSPIKVESHRVSLTDEARDEVMAEMEVERFDEWIRTLDEDVIQAEYGYEPGEFSVHPEHWRPMFNEGLTPSAAFKRALVAHARNLFPVPQGEG